MEIEFVVRGIKDSFPPFDPISTLLISHCGCAPRKEFPATFHLGLTRREIADLVYAKWEFIAKHNLPIAQNVGGKTCILCILYVYHPKREDKEECVRCPIYARTQQTNCKGTPWEKYVRWRTGENATAFLEFLKETLEPWVAENPNTRYEDLQGG